MTDINVSNNSKFIPEFVRRGKSVFTNMFVFPRALGYPSARPDSFLSVADLSQNF